MRKFMKFAKKGMKANYSKNFLKSNVKINPSMGLNVEVQPVVTVS